MRCDSIYVRYRVAIRNILGNRNRLVIMGITFMTPPQRTEYNRLCTEQGKCWKRIADLESQKLALLSEHRGWKNVFEG